MEIVTGAKMEITIESYKEDLKNIINQLGKSASLIGASLGGMVSLCTADDRECGDHAMH